MLWHILCLPVAHGILFPLVKNCKSRIASQELQVKNCKSRIASQELQKKSFRQFGHFFLASLWMKEFSVLFSLLRVLAGFNRNLLTLKELWEVVTIYAKGVKRPSCPSTPLLLFTGEGNTGRTLLTRPRWTQLQIVTNSVYIGRTIKLYRSLPIKNFFNNLLH
jgi:hypothetical protein